MTQIKSRPSGQDHIVLATDKAAWGATLYYVYRLRNGGAYEKREFAFRQNAEQDYDLR